jgi:hypothetical protein
MRKLAARGHVPPIFFVGLMWLLASAEHGWCETDFRKELLLKGAEAAAETYVKDAIRGNTDDLLEFAKQEMLKDPGANKSPQQAEPTIRKIIDQRFHDYIEAQINSAYTSMGLENNGISYDEYRKDVYRGYAATIADIQHEFHDRQSGQIFGKARALAVDEQWRSVNDQEGYPPIQDVERADRDGFETAQQMELKQAIVSRIDRKLPEMFDEVANRSHDLAERVIRDIEAQRAAQAAFVQMPLPDGLVTSGQMMAHLRSMAEDVIAHQRKDAKDGRIIYGLLPSIEHRMLDRTLAEEANRLRNSMATITVPIDIGAVQAEIAADPTRHRERAASESTFVQKYYATAEREVIQTALQRAAEAPDLAEFRARLATALRDPGMTRHALEQRVSASLQKPLDTVRSAVAEEQLRHILPALVDRSWVPDEEVIKVYEKPEAYPREYENVVNLKGVNESGTPMARNSLLRETEELAVKAARALVQQGKRAWYEQDRIVEAEGDSAKERIRSDDRDNRRRAEDSYFQEYRTKSLDDWKARRLATVWPTDQDLPPDKASRYEPLFKEKEERLHEIIHELWQPKNPPPPIEQVQITSRVPGLQLVEERNWIQRLLAWLSNLFGGAKGENTGGSAQGGQTGGGADGGGTGPRSGSLQGSVCPWPISHQSWWLAAAMGLVVFGFGWAVGNRRRVRHA